ncbi:hypothetical protein QUB80_23650 [Chlorogloeopsis sp. ULAP01]|uniref:hypothetical protein n=1 Tax=Chlorogloeopsis sp. ULAP01 TaxID=3056483 RepID=UPI0025AB5363|nr:hypothetical protein [Chlorogloeopsis sp. ULAP01]MDM9383684.1 hypothetical protein [Chlorogloeopsis sp. ULAP01]
MADLSEILRLLEAERDRYVLEAADLERRLSFIRNQIHALEALIPKYVLEEKINHTYKRLPESSVQVLLEDRTHSVEQEELETLDQELETESEFEHNTNPSLSTPQSTSISNTELTTSTQEEPDISDIPKLSVPRKPGTLPLLREFQEYSIQNAILILMRRRPDLHFHIDAIVRDLYGNKLTPEQFKTAKTNVGKMLSTGVQAGLWYRVLHAHGVYTLKHEKGVTSKLLKPLRKK